MMLYRPGGALLDVPVDPGPGEGFFLQASTIVLIVAVIAVIVGVVLFLRRRRR